MAVQQCNACDFITSYSVSYVVTGTASIALTLVDACCRVKSCKMKKAILAKAYCDLRGTMATPDDDGATEPVGPCCCESEVLSYPNATFVYGTNTAVFTGDYSELSDDTIEVSPPLHFVS